MRALAATLIYLLLSGGPATAQELSGRQIVEQVCEAADRGPFRAEMEMLVRTESGNLPTLKYELYGKDGGDKNLIRYTAPGWVEGQALLFLKVRGEAWAYLPGTDEARRLGEQVKQQKIQGSDFSYEDLCDGNSYLDSFDASRLPDEKVEGQDCYTVELTGKAGANSAYSRLVMWVAKNSSVPVAIDYYGAADPDRKLKRLVAKEIRDIDGVPTATRLEMVNKVEKSRTTLRIKTIEYNLQLNDDIFTEAGLSRWNDPQS